MTCGDDYGILSVIVRYKNKCVCVREGERETERERERQRGRERKREGEKYGTK